MSLRRAYDTGVDEALAKFAMSTAFKTKALMNAAARSGARLTPGALAQASNPAAFHAMATNVRDPAAMTPTLPQTHLQNQLENVPWAGAEHGGLLGARQQFDNFLQSTGRTFAAPGINQQLEQTFGPRPGTNPSSYADTMAATPLGRRSRVT
jgi:hypothetical protein